MPRSTKIEAVIRALDQHMLVTRALNLPMSTRLLAMAKLDLQMTLHNVTDHEMRELVQAIGDGNETTAHVQNAAGHRAEQPRRESESQAAASAPPWLDDTAPRNRRRRISSRTRHRS
jgi:hypothetical protein